MSSAKRKPCAIPLCPALRKKGKYVCAAHDKQTTANGLGFTASPRAHKYGAIATHADGIRFDSKAEAAKYQELKLLEKAGVITNLKLQTRWPLEVNGVVIGHYVSDFDFLEGAAHVVVDTKGMQTPLFRWKQKHFEAQTGMRITLA